MKKLIENLADLLKVKTIVTFVVLWVFAKACGAGAIPASEITTIVGMVFAFYFGTQSDKRKRTGADDNPIGAYADALPNEGGGE